MAIPEITVPEFKLILPKICSRDTSMYPEKWNPANSLFAHCLPVSLLAAEIFGMDLYSCHLLDIERCQKLGKHYHNKIEDFTLKQYKYLGYEFEYLAFTEEAQEDIGSILTIAEARGLFETLRDRFITVVTNNP